MPMWCDGDVCDIPGGGSLLVLGLLRCHARHGKCGNQPGNRWLATCSELERRLPYAASPASLPVPRSSFFASPACSPSALAGDSGGLVMCGADRNKSRQ